MTMTNRKFTRPIAITAKNAALIDAALAAANGGAQTHTYKSYSDIAQLATQAEKRLLEIVTYQKYCPGAEFHAISGEKMPRAYRYSRQATAVSLRRGQKSWYLQSVSGAQIFADGGRTNLSVPVASYRAGEASRLREMHVSIVD